MKYSLIVKGNKKQILDELDRMKKKYKGKLLSEVIEIEKDKKIRGIIAENGGKVI